MAASYDVKAAGPVPHTVGAWGTGAVNITMHYSTPIPDQRVTNDLKTIMDKRSDVLSGSVLHPYDFRSIIDSKLSDINLESFGREWLYLQMHEWLSRPESTSKVLVFTGEPVRHAPAGNSANLTDRGVLMCRGSVNRVPRFISFTIQR